MTHTSSPRTRGDILVVDDTPANLQLLSQLLQEVGYRVRAVTSGARALSAARTAIPDLILLDVRLPDIDGYSVCAQLKADPRTQAVPVIFISALSEPEAKLNAFGVGGVDYVTKPLHPDEILARVQTHLALRELHLQLHVANNALAERLSELEHSNSWLQREIAARRTAEELSRHLLNQERRRVERLYALRTAMTAIADALEPPRVQIAVVEQVTELLGAARSALALVAAKRGPLQIVAVSGLPAELIGHELAPGEGVVGMAAARGAIISSADSAPAPSDAIFGPGAAMAAPLRAQDALVGVVVVLGPHERSSFDSDDGQMLGLFAQQAAIAVQNASLFAEVRQLAQIDPLTGLHNRRHFFDIAGRELERVRRINGELAVLMLDLDHFKQVNDHFGHQAGDQALRAVAELLRATLRVADTPARFGGEELVVLLPDTDLAHAMQAAERLCETIARLALETERGLVRLTVSVGVAALESKRQSESIECLLGRADEALYEAKARGRNQVARWQATAPSLQ